MLSSEEVLLSKRIGEDESYRRWFFAQAKHLKWFYPLKDGKYFSPETIPVTPEGSVLFWDVLNYLERVSKQVAGNPEQNGEYGKELLNIIGDAVRFSRDIRRINNPHIWWYCVKIVNNLSAPMIKASVSIEDQADGSSTRYGFGTWLLTWTDTAVAGDLAITDVAEKLLGKFLGDDSALEYAEVIIDVLTRIKASGRMSSLDGKDDAVLVCDSYWVAGAFQKYHEQIGTKCSAGLIYSIADKLKRALEYKRQDFAVEIKIGDEVYELGISRLAADGLRPGEIGFKKGVYQCVLKQYAPEQVKGLDLSENFWALYKIEPEIERKSFQIHVWNREGFISLAMENLPTDVDWASARELPERLGALFEGLYEDYSSVLSHK